MAAGVGPAVAVVRSRWDVVRWLLLAAWIVITLVGLATTSRSSSFSALQADLDGGVDHVTVAGSPSDDGVQEVRWRSGLLRHKVLVAVDPSSREAFSADGLTLVPARDVGTVLTAGHPDLRVSRATLDADQARSQANPDVQVGFRITTPFDGAVGVAAVVHGLLTLALIVFGPEPWRATRWVWFWLLGVPYLGLPAFLLLSGPTRGLPPPSSAPRLTGGKASVLGAVAFTAASFLGVA